MGGTYSTSGPAQTDPAVCVACVAGRYSTSGEGQTVESTCEPCVNGKFSDVVGLSWLAGDEDLCTNCGLGQYGSGTAKVSSASCVACALGQYSPALGAPNCEDCPR